MGLFSIREIKNLLQKYQSEPEKRLGQHFLINSGVARQVVEAAKIRENDVILEIGPGIGNLTRELAQRAKKVIAVEKDTKMIRILKETLNGIKNIEVINQDIRKLKFQIPDKYKIVGNLPFYLTAPVIRQFLEPPEKSLLPVPELMALIVQKEVAQRICSKPPHMSLLAISVQFYAEPKIISYISKNSFWPSPKVDSAIIKLKTQSENRKVNIEQFFRIVKTGFSHPRKQLINNLSTGFCTSREAISQWLTVNNIKPAQRAETLTLENWLNLTKSFKIKENEI